MQRLLIGNDLVLPVRQEAKLIDEDVFPGYPTAKSHDVAPF
jgi:hypothetical protein